MAKHRLGLMKGHPDPDAYKREQLCTATPMPRSQAIPTAPGGHWSTSSRWLGQTPISRGGQDTDPNSAVRSGVSAACNQL